MELDRETVAQLVSEQHMCDPIFFCEMVDCGIAALVDRNLTRVKPE